MRGTSAMHLGPRYTGIAAYRRPAPPRTDDPAAPYRTPVSPIAGPSRIATPGRIGHQKWPRHPATSYPSPRRHIAHKPASHPAFTYVVVHAAHLAIPTHRPPLPDHPPRIPGHFRPHCPPGLPSESVPLGAVSGVRAGGLRGRRPVRRGFNRRPITGRPRRRRGMLTSTGNDARE
jgi:hypothetical protein